MKKVIKNYDKLNRSWFVDPKYENPSDLDLELNQMNNRVLSILLIKAGTLFLEAHLDRIQDVSTFLGEYDGSHGYHLQKEIVEFLDQAMARELVLQKQKAKERSDYLEEEIRCGLDGDLYE
jgi:hypothetical protein